MSKIVEKKIIEICDIANSDKTITREKAKENEGIYPVYAATINSPFAFINFYNNDKPSLVVVNDGAAGSTYIVADEKYTIGKHITGLIPHDGIDIQYLQFVSEPVFKKIAKGYGLGNLPQADIKTAMVSIPVKDDGSYDIEEQKRFAGIYSEIENQKQKLLNTAYDIQEILIHIEKESEIQYEDVPLQKLFTLRNGNSAYTKTYTNKHNGLYPLYSANTDGPYAFINSFDYDGDYLTWAKDGLAGYIMVHNGEKFSITGHRSILLPKSDVSNVFLPYVKYCLEPIFRKLKKGRVGALGANEYTTLNLDMIKRAGITIPIPLDSKGTYDIKIQEEIADKYKQIDEIKQGLIDKIQYLVSISVVPETAE